MAQLTSQCTNTIYRWQFKRCGSPQQDKGQAVPGGCSLPGCSRGLGRGVSARCWAGWRVGGRPSSAPKMHARVSAHQAGVRGETLLKESANSLQRKAASGLGCLLPEPGAGSGERVVTGYSTYLAPCICKPRQFPEQSPRHQKRWGELPAKARGPPSPLPRPRAGKAPRSDPQRRGPPARARPARCSSANYISANV